jgi:hypothetical protein
MHWCIIRHITAMLIIKNAQFRRGHFVLVDYYFAIYHVSGRDVIMCGRGFRLFHREKIGRHWDKYNTSLDMDVRLFIDSTELLTDRFFNMMRDLRQLYILQRIFKLYERNVEQLYYNEQLHYDYEDLRR